MMAHPADPTNPVRAAALGMDLPAFRAFMAERRDAMAAAALAEHAARPRTVAARMLPIDSCITWREVPDEAWERADERAWRWYRGLATA